MREFPIALALCIASTPCAASVHSTAITQSAGALVPSSGAGAAVEELVNIVNGVGSFEEFVSARFSSAALKRRGPFDRATDYRHLRRNWKGIRLLSARTRTDGTMEISFVTNKKPTIGTLIAFPSAAEPDKVSEIEVLIAGRSYGVPREYALADDDQNTAAESER